MTAKAITAKRENIDLWWEFWQRRNDAYALYYKTADTQYLTQAKYMQGLMDDCWKEIQQNR